MRRKFFGATVLATTLTTVVSASAGCSSPYYPLDELDSSDVNQEALKHFKKVLADSKLFDEDSRFAIQVGAHGSNWCATIYELDYTGKEINRYFTANDIFEEDILSAVCDGLWGWNYNFDYYFPYNLEIVGEEIYGSRTLPSGWELKTDIAKEQLISAGYPDLSFDYEDGKFTYGKFEISGDLAEDLLSSAFNGNSIGNYTFYDSYGTLFSERLS